MIDEKLLHFVQEHADEDPLRLALEGDKYPGVDVSLASRAIAARHKLRLKVPTWYACPQVFVEDRVAVEQSSSEIAARFKVRLLPDDVSVGIDLTGGLGVDSYFLAQKMSEWHYLDADPRRVMLATHNFQALGAEHIHTHSGKAETEGVELMRELRPQLIYLDPDRRPGGGSRKFHLSDSTPDILSLIPCIFELSTHAVILVKLSPLIDITYLKSLDFPLPFDTYILSVGREAKEVLIRFSTQAAGSTYAIEIGPEKILCEKAAILPTSVPVSDKVGNYMYDLYPSFAKVGIDYFPQFADHLIKPDRNTHLYFSDELINNFPGRAFKVLEFGKWSGQIAKKFSGTTLHLVTKNLKTSTDNFRSRLKIKEGGELFLFIYAAIGRKSCYVLAKAI